MHIIIIFFICLLVQYKSACQQNIALKWQGHLVELDSHYTNKAGNQLCFNKIKLYMGNYSLYKDSVCIGRAQDSIIFIDYKKQHSLDIILHDSTLQANRLSFDIGLDSSINCSGAYDGVLDPLKGMYWSWQSGYINCKMEGFYKTKNKEKVAFNYHIGGYQYPYAAIRKVSLDIAASDNYTIVLQLEKLFNNWDVEHHQNIMRPCKAANLFADRLAQAFDIEYE